MAVININVNNVLYSRTPTTILQYYNINIIIENIPTETTNIS